jgi:hypothetical protein
MANLSVIIITRNRLNKLKRCLSSIEERLPGSEVIVVDNGSTDGTDDFLKGYRDIKTIFLTSNIGPAAARNMAIKDSSRNNIMFLDDDAWIDQIDIEEIIRFFAEHLDVGIIAPRLFYPDGEVQESVRSFPTIFFILWRGTFLRRIFPRVHWYNRHILSEIIHSASKPCMVDWAISACFIVRRSIFDQIGLFDDKYFIYYEDADLCYRAKMKGFSVYYWPDAVVYHDYARNSSKGMNLHLFRHLSSIYRFFHKYSKKGICG